MLGFYAAWAGFVVMASLMRAGLSADNFTRLLIIAFLATSLAWYWRTKDRATSQTPWAFVLACSVNAMVVEFCYMFSRPVFPSLLVVPGTSMAQCARNTLVDFAFTFPAYLVIFSLFWFLVHRYQYCVAEYVLLFSLGQALGDGNAFFRANPGMLLLAPYVMLNYQAINVVPYLRVRSSLPSGRGTGMVRYAAPLVLIPLLYWIMGAAIIGVGRLSGLGNG